MPLQVTLCNLIKYFFVAKNIFTMILLMLLDPFLPADDTRSFCGQCRSRSDCTEQFSSCNKSTCIFLANEKLQFIYLVLKELTLSQRSPGFYVSAAQVF